MAFFGTFWALYFTIQLPALRTESAYIRDRYSFQKKNEPERRSGLKKKNRNAVPVRSGPIRTLAVMCNAVRQYTPHTFCSLHQFETRRLS